jgi:hypothetical protein
MIYKFTTKPRFTMRTVLLIAVLIVLMMGECTTCTLLHWQPAPVEKVILDSAANEHSV